MVYWCDNCGCEVKEPRFVKVEEIHYEVDTRCVEEWEQVICPYCGHEVDKAEQCEVCGDYMSPNNVTGICDFCEDVIKTEYGAMLDKVAERLGITAQRAREEVDEWYSYQ